MNIPVTNINELEIYKLLCKVARAMVAPAGKPWLSINAFTVDYNDVLNYGNLNREYCDPCNSTFYSELWEQQGMNTDKVVWTAPAMVLTPLSSSFESFEPNKRRSQECFDLSFWLFDFWKDTCEICPKDERNSRTVPEIWSDLRDVFKKFIFEFQKHQFILSNTFEYRPMVKNYVINNYDHFGSYNMVGINVMLKLCIETNCSEGEFDYDKPCPEQITAGCCPDIE